MGPRNRYTVRVFEGQVVNGEKSERMTLETYTTASSEKQAINNVKFRNKIRTGRNSINGYGDYTYTRMEIK